MDNILTFIGLMRRAGALELGADATFDACRRGRARLVVTAADAAGNTVRAARAAAEEMDTPHIELARTKEELGHALGRGECAVFAITDTGLARALCQKTGQAGPIETLESRLRREKRSKSPNRGKPDTSARRGTKR